MQPPQVHLLQHEGLLEPAPGVSLERPVLHGRSLRATRPALMRTGTSVCPEPGLGRSPKPQVTGQPRPRSGVKPGQDPLQGQTRPQPRAQTSPLHPPAPLPMEARLHPVRPVWSPATSPRAPRVAGRRGGRLRRGGRRPCPRRPTRRGVPCMGTPSSAGPLTGRGVGRRPAGGTSLFRLPLDPHARGTSLRALGGWEGEIPFG